MEIQKFVKYSEKRNQKKTAYKPLGDTVVMLGLTYKCQCKCVHCGVALNQKQKEKELTGREIFKIIDDCSKLGAWVIYFFGGEPLIVPEIAEYVKYVSSLNMKSCIDTNGYLLTEKMVLKLKQSDIGIIRISIDSPHENIHDELRGQKGLFKKAMEGLMFCKKHGIKTMISTYATKETLKNGDLKKTIQMAKDLRVKIRIVSAVCSGKWVNNESIKLSSEENQIIHSLLEEDVVFWENSDNKSQPFYCPSSAKEYFSITPYGDVQPCCFLPLTFGNIRKEPLKNVVQKMWDSNLFKNCNIHVCLANTKFAKTYLQNYG